MLTGYLVCDAMTKRPVIVNTEMSLKECAMTMAKHNIGSLLIQKNNVLKGIITEEDIVRKIVAKGIEPESSQIQEHMSKDVTTISPEKDIFDALQVMMTFKIRQLPVMDGKNMIGLLTQNDILKIEPELFDLMVDKIEIKEEEHKPISNEGLCQECGNYSRKLVTRNEAMICKACYQ